MEALAPLVDQRSRALAISFVTLTGLRIDLKPFGQFCKAHDMVFVVDAIQGIGRLQLDIEDALGGLGDVGYAPDPEELAEAQLEELKRRMARGTDDD